ncbi:GntR family transcriptional regulator [Cognatishimia sp. SS12]|uniref:GntR family transcriptional regulator n=1 Tax=Cognatishimia sp. SS12 TaxID=2979465 RepID=UPI00232BE2C4|nr:GntR family transcriptional regulator [Cognatishimia sp. SS12]MDC0739591.1 GntR family transcriptional regulator [Cognatishimia sp. SS12]
MDTLYSKFLNRPEQSNMSASTRVFLALRARILNLELPPNTVLVRSELAAEYDVSATPIREAMQRLEKDGLLDIFPHAKTCVSAIDIEQLREAQFLRLALESEAVRRVAADPDPEVISNLRAIIRMAEALGNEPAVESMFNELDETFHKTIFDSIGQGAQHQLIKSQSGNIARAGKLYHRDPKRNAGVIADHTKILNAIEAADIGGAQDAIRSHLSVTISRLEDLRLQHPDYFK